MEPIVLTRRRVTAYKTTMKLYQDKKNTADREKNSDLGFSRGKIVKVCDTDFVADVELTFKKTVKGLSALNKLYAKDDLAGEHSWFWSKTTTEEFNKIRNEVQVAVGAAFLQAGIHPYALYSKQVDVR